MGNKPRVKETIPLLSHHDIDQIAGAFKEEGWKPPAHIAYLLIMITGLITFVTAMSMVGGGTKYAWSEYDGTLYENTNYTFDYSEESKTDIYFVDLNLAYKEIVWTAFGLTTFMAVIIIAVVSSNVNSGENCHKDAHSLVHQLMMYMEVIAIIGLLLIVTQLHGAYENDDQDAGVHLNQKNLESNSEINVQLTERHKDGLPVTLIISSLILYITAPVIVIMLQLGTYILTGLKNRWKYVERMSEQERISLWLSLVNRVNFKDRDVKPELFSAKFKDGVLSSYRTMEAREKGMNLDSLNQDRIHDWFNKAHVSMQRKNLHTYNSGHDMPAINQSSGSSTV
jgi:hypothetical protein